MDAVTAIQSARSSIGAFGGWWFSELAGLVPRQLANLFARKQARFVLAMDGDGFRLLSEGGRSIARGTPKPRTGALPEMAAALAKLLLRAPKTPVGIRLRLADCLTRRVKIPRQARDKLRSILDLDIERATPFSRGDLYFDYTQSPAAGPDGRLDVEQVMVERSLVDPVLAQLRSQGIEVKFIDCWSENGALPLPVNLLGPAAGAPASSGTLPRTLTWALAILVPALALGAGLLDFDRYENALATLESDIQASRKEAASLRRSREDSLSAQAAAARLLARKQQQSTAVTILEDITRRLPDDSWLTSLRIEGGIIDMTGFSKSATTLVTTFQKGANQDVPGAISARLSDPQLTSPVTFDLNKDREQFSLRLNVDKGRATIEPAVAKTGAAQPAAPGSE